MWQLLVLTELLSAGVNSDIAVRAATELREVDGDDLARLAAGLVRITLLHDDGDPLDR